MVQRIWKWLLVLVLAGIVGWGAAYLIHSAHAAVHPDGGMKIIPRGPGGPPVVVDQEEDEAQPKWKIVVTIEAQDGKHSLAYGTADRTGIQWYKDLAECEKAKKTDARLNSGLKLLKQQLKQMKQQVELTVECKPDNSV